MHLFISKVNHLQTKTMNESEETEYNDYKPLQNDQIANLIDVYFLQGNHGSGSHPDEDIKDFKKHRISDHLYIILLSMDHTWVDFFKRILHMKRMFFHKLPSKRKRKSDGNNSYLLNSPLIIIDVSTDNFYLKNKFPVLKVINS